MSDPLPTTVDRDLIRSAAGSRRSRRIRVMAAIILTIGMAPWDALSPHLTPARPLRAQETADDDAQVRQQLDEILEHPDFRRLRLELNPPEVKSSWFERFADWLDGFFRPINAPNVSWIGDAFRIFAYAVMGVLVCGIIWLIVKAINAWRSWHREKIAGIKPFEEGTAELPPGDIPADEYLRRARELSAQGLYGEAIAQLLLGAMSATERSGLIRFRRGLTYRDYVRALRQKPEPCQSFRQMVSIYLPIGFGRRSALNSQFEAALAAYETAFTRALTPENEKPVAPHPESDGSHANETAGAIPREEPAIPRQAVEMTGGD